MKELDPLLHSQLRLAVVSLLMQVDEADFTYLREKTGATAGNLSVQLDKLASAGYIDMMKLVSSSRPRTICRMNSVGRQAFARYVEALKSYLPGL